MAELTISQVIQADQVGTPGAGASGKNQGILKTEGNEHTLFAYAETEAATEEVFQFLQEINQQEKENASLQKFEFVFITQEMIATEQAIGEMLAELSESPESEQPMPEGGKTLGKNEIENSSVLRELQSAHRNEKNSHLPQQGARPKESEIHSSLFSLARSVNSQLTQNKEFSKAQQKNSEKAETRQENHLAPAPLPKTERQPQQENRYDREGEGKQKGKEENNKEGSPQDQQKQQKRDKTKAEKQKVVSIGSIKAARNETHSGERKNRVPSIQANKGVANPSATKGPVGSVENIFIRFMALMARILAQAELEAHELYSRIKERTDSIDVLTLFISKINSEKGAIDWSKNDELKHLVDKARAIGVDIPQGKYSWSEEEKKLLKENVQMRKDSMEKMTQLERTDMQRYLQEASQCHQARSNVLKLLKEVLDNIIGNMRP